MNKKELEKELEKANQLRKELKKAIEAYYQKDNPFLTDAEYDAKLRQLEQLEAGHGDLIPSVLSTPSAQVGARPSSRFPTYQHPTAMLSLANAFSEKEFFDFVQRIEKKVEQKKIDFSAELKLDGIAVNLLYEQGQLVVAATRGDGRIGEDISQNIKTIATVPKTISVVEPVEIRGEVVMHFEDFMALNENQRLQEKKEFANPRNAAGGSLRHLDINVSASRPLYFYAHGIGIAPVSIPQGQYEILSWLEKNGFQISAPRLLSSDIDELLKYYYQVQKERVHFPYATDGVVFKVNQIALHEKIGSTTKAPRFALAYKFSAEEATTVLLAIDMQVGRTGVLTPVARLKPVSVGGVVISNATLHNVERIAEKDIRIGDVVQVRRAGEVIPELIRVLFEKREYPLEPWRSSIYCPVCKQQARKDGRFYRCVNQFCQGRLQAQMTHFVSRKALDIDGVGDILLKKLFDKNCIKTPADLFKLTKEDLLSLDLIEELSANNVLKAIASSRKTTLSRFIFALGIHGVGEKMSEQLAGFFGNLDSIISATRPIYAFIPDIGVETSLAIVQYFSDSENKKQINQLRTLGVVWPEKKFQAEERAVPLVNFLQTLIKLKDFTDLRRETMPSVKGLGQKKIKKLVQYFDSIEQLMAAEESELMKVLYDTNLVQQLQSLFSHHEYQSMMAHLSELGFVWRANVRVNLGILQGKTFILTGQLSSLTREQARQLIEEAGGKVSTTVSASTDYIVVGEKPGAQKIKGAQKLSIPSLTEQEFEKMVGKSETTLPIFD